MKSELKLHLYEIYNLSSVRVIYFLKYLLKLLFCIFISNFCQSCPIGSQWALNPPPSKVRFNSENDKAENYKRNIKTVK